MDDPGWTNPLVLIGALFVLLGLATWPAGALLCASGVVLADVGLNG